MPRRVLVLVAAALSLSYVVERPSSASAQASVPNLALAPGEPSASDDASRERSNYVALEWLGNGGLYSLNYHRALSRGIWARAGLSYLGLGAGVLGVEGSARLLTAPLMLEYVGIGSQRHRLVLGLGTTLLYATAELRLLARLVDAGRLVVAGTGTLGYRYLGRRITFGVGFTPIFGAGVFVPWGAASFGIGF